MFRQTSSWIGVLALAVFLGLGAPPAPAADQVGSVLVDRLVLFFNQTASSTTVSYATINQAISEMMAQAKSARAEQRINQEFFDRYTRVLRIFKLRITDDKEGILGSIVDKEYTAFVQDVTGKKVEGVPSIPTLSQAITQELGNLKKLVDRKP